MSKKNELDQYYTNPEYAKQCFDIAMDMYDGELLVEPCAGTGSFFNLMPESNRLGMDLDPKVKGKGMLPDPQDFLEYKGSLEGAFVISNPPFGKNASLAVAFFNKCAELGAKVIAFVIPKTFRKASVVNKLSEEFDIVYDDDSPKNSFILDGVEYDVPCCFQVWIRKDQPREVINTGTENEFFEFVKKGDHDLVVRRAGARAGQLIENETDSKESSNYFVKSITDLDKLVVVLRGIDLSKERENTAGVRSVAKYELVNKVKEAFV